MWPIGTLHNFLQYKSTQIPTEYGDKRFRTTSYCLSTMVHGVTSQNTAIFTVISQMSPGVNGFLSFRTWRPSSDVTIVRHWKDEKGHVFFPLRELGRTPFYVRLQSAWGSVNSDCDLLAFRWDGCLLETWEGCLLETWEGCLLETWEGCLLETWEGCLLET